MKQKCGERRPWKLIHFPGSFIPTAPDYQCSSRGKTGSEQTLSEMKISYKRIAMQEI